MTSNFASEEQASAEAYDSSSLQGLEKTIFPSSNSLRPAEMQLTGLHVLIHEEIRGSGAIGSTDTCRSAVCVVTLDLSTGVPAMQAALIERLRLRGHYSWPVCKAAHWELQAECGPQLTSNCIRTLVVHSQPTHAGVPCWPHVLALSSQNRITGPTLWRGWGWSG